MSKKSRRPARFRAGHKKNEPAEMMERVLLSRERLAASDLAGSAQAWRLWSVCIAVTAGQAKAAEENYAASLGTLAGVHRVNAGRLLRRFNELGVVVWDAAPPTSKGISVLTLPGLPAGASTVYASEAPTLREPPASEASTLRETARREAPTLHTQSDESLGSTPYDSTLDIDIGEHHSSPSLSSPRGDGSESWEAERPASREDGPSWDTEELARQLDAELGAPEPFAPFHGDERTGEAVGDDERSQMRWEADNPAKARARKRVI